MNTVDLENLKSVNAISGASTVSDNRSWLFSASFPPPILAGAGWLPLSASETHMRPTKKEDGGIVVNPKYGFQKHMIKFRNTELAPIVVPSTYSYQKEDSLFPEIVLINGHDGTTSLKLMAGLFRMVCSNGLVVSESTFASASIMHTGNIREQISSVVSDIVKRVPLISNKIASFQIPLTTEQRLDYGEQALKLKYGTHEQDLIKYDVHSLIEPVRREDTAGSLWTTYNTVQEKLITGGNFRTSTRKVKATKSIGESIQVNRKLWELTEQFAKVA